MRPWVVEGSSTVNPTGWTTVGILSIRLIPSTYLNPEGGGDGAGNTEGNIDVDVNKEGDVCLTCGARARSVGVREVVHTGQNRSADASQVTTRDAVRGQRSSKGEWPGLAQIESSSGAGRRCRRNAGCCG